MFQQGQFFHPIYGWFDKEPDFQRKNNRGMITEPIGEDLAINLDDLPVQFADSLMNLIERFKERARHYEEMMEAGLINPPTVPPPEPDLSCYMDKSRIGTSDYYFEYNGNTVTAKVNVGLSAYDPVDMYSRYEKHRQNIMDMQKLGYNDEAIKMLIAALDEQLRKSHSSLLHTQLWGLSYGQQSQSMAKAIALANEYLSVRGSGGSVAGDLNIAASNLQKRGELSSSFRVDYKMKFVDKELEKRFYESLAQMNAWAEERERERIRKDSAFKELWNQMQKNGDVSLSPWDGSETHIRDLSYSELHEMTGISKIRDFSWDDSMSDREKEARSLSIVFRVRGDQMIDYARRYEELSGELDDKLSNGEISEPDYGRYVADLNTAFVKTYNLNIMGQAMAAGLSEEKATELAMAFSEEYIKIREQTDPNERNADKIASAALQKITTQGWPAFSLYSSEDRAMADDDPWYAMLSEDTLYWAKMPKPYANWYGTGAV